MYGQQKRNIIHMSSTAYEQDHSAAAPPRSVMTSRRRFIFETGEGRKNAMERGVRFGRPRKLTAHQRQEALQRIAAGETHRHRQAARRQRAHHQPLGGFQPFRAKCGRPVSHSR
jgi:hypothetical protein